MTVTNKVNDLVDSWVNYKFIFLIDVVLGVTVGAINKLHKHEKYHLA